MKVLYCESGSGRGGSAISLAEFLKACRGTSIEPVIACTTEAARTLYEPMGYPVHAIEGRGGIGGSVMRLWQVIQATKPDLVHANNDIYSHIGTILGGRARGIPIVAHHRAARPLTRAERMLWRRVARHVAVSHYVRDNLVDHGADPASIEVVYDAMAMPQADRLDRTFARRTLGINSGAWLVGTVGSLRPEKGLEIFVDAAAELIDRIDIHFVIVGGDFHRSPGYGEHLKRRVAERGMADRFHFTGHVTDTLSWIGSMDLLVFPTLLPEGFGRASLEGMACGVPVIASAIGAIVEVVREGLTGYLVNPGDAEVLAQKIRLALARDLTDLIARARQTAATKFSPTAQVANMLRIYRGTLDGKAYPGVQQ